MILSDSQIRARGIVSPCEERGQFRGMSFGLSACGYDIRFDYEAIDEWYDLKNVQTPEGEGILLAPGTSVLVGSQELFDMPDNVVGLLKDKSTWARQGVLVNQAVLEPGWRGHMSVLLYNVGREDVAIVHGDPIAQVIFQTTGEVDAVYNGKYQNQKGGQGPIVI